VTGSGISWAICTSAPRPFRQLHQQPTNSVFTGRIPVLLPKQQCQSTEGKAQKATENCSKRYTSITFTPPYYTAKWGQKLVPIPTIPTPPISILTSSPQGWPPSPSPLTVSSSPPCPHCSCPHSHPQLTKFSSKYFQTVLLLFVFNKHHTIILH